MRWEIIEHEGELGITCGWDSSWQSPELIRPIWYWPGCLKDRDYLVGRAVEQSDIAEGWVYREGDVTLIFRESSALRACQAKPYPKPRGRGWVYRNGRWEKH